MILTKQQLSQMFYFKDQFLSNSGVSIAGLFCFDFLVVVRAVLRSVVRAGVGCVTVWSVWLSLLLLMVDRHQVLHVHGVLPLLVCPDADSGQAGNIIIYILANNDRNVEYEVTNILEQDFI